MKVFLFNETMQSYPMIIDLTLIQSDDILFKVKRKHNIDDSSIYLNKGDYYLILSRDEILNCNFLSVTMKINSVINISFDEVIQMMFNERVNISFIFNIYNQRTVDIVSNENKRHFLWSKSIEVSPNCSRLIDFLLRFDVDKLSNLPSNNLHFNNMSTISCLSMILNRFSIKDKNSISIPRLLTMLYLIENNSEHDDRRMLTGNAIDNFYQLILDSKIIYPDFLIYSWEIIRNKQELTNYNISEIQNLVGFRIQILLGERLYNSINWKNLVLTSKTLIDIIDSIIHHLNIEIELIEFICRDIGSIPSFLFANLIERNSIYFLFVYNGMRILFLIDNNIRRTLSSFSFSIFKCYYTDKDLFISPLALYSIMNRIILIYESGFIIEVDELKKLIDSGYTLVTNNNEKNKIMNELSNEIVNIN